MDQQSLLETVEECTVYLQKTPDEQESSKNPIANTTVWPRPSNITAAGIFGPDSVRLQINQSAQFQPEPPKMQGLEVVEAKNLTIAQLRA